MVKIKALYNDGPASGYSVGDVFEANLYDGYYCFHDNKGRYRVRHKSEFDLPSDDLLSPIRTVMRKEIVPGTYGIISVTKENKILIKRGSYTHEQLREAAHTLNQIAEVVEDETTN